MPINTLAAWHRVVHDNGAGLDELLADEVVFYSPVVHTPQVGIDKTTMYLESALRVLVNHMFRYSRQVVGERDAVLEFETVIDDVVINGVDMIRWNAEGRIVEFKVMLRPLKAIQLVHQRMKEQLAASAAAKDAAGS